MDVYIDIAVLLQWDISSSFLVKNESQYCIRKQQAVNHDSKVAAELFWPKELQGSKVSESIPWNDTEEACTWIDSNAARQLTHTPVHTLYTINVSHRETLPLCNINYDTDINKMH